MNTRTLAARLEEPGTPLNLSAPPNLSSFPMTTSQSALHEPVAAEIVSVLDDLVPLLRRLLLGRTTHIYVKIKRCIKCMWGKHLPDEPRATGSVRAVLSPGTEVVPTCDALPTRAPDGEVGLPGEVLLGCPTISIAQICVVYVAEVQSQTLVRVPDRPAVHATQQKGHA